MSVIAFATLLEVLIFQYFLWTHTHTHRHTHTHTQTAACAHGVMIEWGPQPREFSRGSTIIEPLNQVHMYHVSTAHTQHVVASHSRDQASVVLLWGSRKQYQFSARREVVREPLMKTENDDQNFVHISCSFLTTVYAASVHVKKVLHISRQDWIPLGTSLVTESPSVQVWLWTLT